MKGVTQYMKGVTYMEDYVIAKGLYNRGGVI